MRSRSFPPALTQSHGGNPWPSASSPRDRGRAFRYAPLSSGLDIARKSLGRHAIAIVQSTVIDKDTGFVRLNTALVHSSGEWVASEWPVCPMGDTASPQRMGAALTYARRYALFTLVGIAGEDDLDAPDLGAVQNLQTGQPIGSNGQSGPREHVAGDQSRGTRARSRLSRTPKALLEPDSSAALRDQLMDELAAIATAGEAVTWAKRSLPAKNTLTSADADIVEQAFRTKMQLENYKTFAALPARPRRARPQSLTAVAPAQRLSLAGQTGEPRRRYSLSAPQ